MKQFMEILEIVLGNVLSEKAEIILMVDFNVDMMDISSSQACDILALVISSGLTACINIPTRISNQSATLIDNVFSSIHSVKNEVLLSDTSDHFPVGVLLPLPRLARRIAPDNKPRFRYTPANIEKLKDVLFATSWSVQYLIG